MVAESTVRLWRDFSGDRYHELAVGGPGRDLIPGEDPFGRLASTTDLAYRLTVVDTVAGTSRVYGFDVLVPAITDSAAFPAPDPDGVLASGGSSSESSSLLCGPVAGKA